MNPSFFHHPHLDLKVSQLVNIPDTTDLTWSQVPLYRTKVNDSVLCLLQKTIEAAENLKGVLQWEADHVNPPRGRALSCGMQCFGPGFSQAGNPHGKPGSVKLNPLFSRVVSRFD